MYVSKHLSLDPDGPPARLRPVGYYAPERRAYASERNVAYGGNVNPSRNRKGGSGNPPTKGRRTPALSRPPFTTVVLLTNPWNTSKLLVLGYFLIPGNISGQPQSFRLIF